MRERHGHVDLRLQRLEVGAILLSIRHYRLEPICLGRGSMDGARGAL